MIDLILKELKCRPYSFRTVHRITDGDCSVNLFDTKTNQFISATRKITYCQNSYANLMGNPLAGLAENTSSIFYSSELTDNEKDAKNLYLAIVDVYGLLSSREQQVKRNKIFLNYL